MKIKCANCDQKVINFKNAFLNFHDTSCPNCKSHLEFKSTKAYQPLALLNIILIGYIVIKTENGQLNKLFGYLILAIAFLSTLFFTTQTIKRISPAPKNTKSSKYYLILKITIVVAAFLYPYLRYDLNMSDELPLIRGLQILLILGPIYWIYTIKKNNKK